MATEPTTDADELEPSAESAFVAAMGRLLEDDLDRAESYLLQSLAKSAKLTPNGIQWANTATSLANIARERGKFSEAQRYLENVLAIRRKMQPDSLFLASVLIGLGNLNRARGRHAEAEDAFQATFLQLARKAGSIRATASVGSWLYGVAYRSALKARAELWKRQKHDRKNLDQMKM